jgi:hypothetical protein
MNCDQVFDILTRGPFPTGHRSDRAVELHLATCSECQRLANALRPAVELFQEALSGDEGRELPGYWGGMIDESEEFQSSDRSTQVAQHLPAALHRRIDRSCRWVAAQTGGSGMRFVAAMLIGVALGAVVWTAGVPASDAWTRQEKLAAAPRMTDTTRRGIDEHTSASLPGWSNSQTSSKTREMHVSLQLSEACLTDRMGGEATSDKNRTETLSIADLARQHCCTRCHHALANNSLPQATVVVAHSCEICHR